MQRLVAPSTLALLAFFTASTAQPAGAQTVGALAVAPSPQRAVPVGLLDGLARQRVVGVAPGASASGLAAATGAVVVDQFGSGLVSMGLNGPGQVVLLEWPTIALAQRGEGLLKTLPGTLFAEPNRLAKSPGTVVCPPPSAAGAQQCTTAFFDGTPQLPKYAGQAALPAMNATGGPALPALPRTVVAIVDTGIDPLHPIFQGRLEGLGYDFLEQRIGGFDLPNGKDDDFDGLVDEAHGHGTHVAGLVALMDPSARLLSLRVLDADGNGSAFAVAEAIHFAGEYGADVINLSLSLSGPSAAVEAALDSLDDDDTVVFASAGNSGVQGVAYPARYPGVIAVAAVDSLGVAAPFATFGPEVDLVAPGVDVYSAMPNGAWAWWSGSSMSTALASGAAARLCSAWSEDADESAGAMLDSAKPVGAQNPAYLNLLGKGMVDLGAAHQLMD